jgi:hypothetical protein
VAVFTVLVSEIRHSAAPRVAALGLLSASAAMGQASSPPSVQGVAFDSLRGVPLAGAFVTVVGAGRSTTSDSLGRFRFDSLGAGTYSFAIQHDVLDSIGVGSITTRTTVRGGDDEVRMAVPSLATLWRRWCQGVAPKDTGLVHGVVRDVEGNPAVGATIEVSWTDLSVENKVVRERGKIGHVVADANGNYALCGIPANTMVQLRATRDSATSGSLDLILLQMLVSHRDLRIADGSQGSGTITGIVTQGGRPFAGARVVVGDRPELRTGSDGHFIVRDVPAGTRQVDLFAVGMIPGSVVVDVPVHDTALVRFDMQKVVRLPGVTVAGSVMRKTIFADIDYRRRTGFGHFVDSMEIAKLGSLSAAFGSTPFARVVSRGGHIDKVMVTVRGFECEAAYLIDGLVSERDELIDLTPQSVVAIEVYSRLIPSDIMAKLHRRPGCGVVAFWTRRYEP